MTTYQIMLDEPQRVILKDALETLLSDVQSTGVDEEEIQSLLGLFTELPLRQREAESGIIHGFCL